MRSAAQIIAESNLYLDALSQPKDFGEAVRRISQLTKLRDEMLYAGFNKTFSFIFHGSDELPDPDAARQLSIFREFANLKRYTLRRVRIALAAHKIFASAARRARRYAFVEHLPFAGDYVERLVYYGEPAIRAYQHLIAIFSGRRGRSALSVTYIKGGRRQRARVTSVADIALLVRDGARIVGVKEVVSSRPLIAYKGVRIAAACAYAVAAARAIVPDTNSVDVKYAEALKKYGYSPLARIDFIEGNEELKEFLYSEGILLWDGDWRLRHEIADEIAKERSKLNEKVVARAQQAVAEDVLDFLLSETQTVRTTAPLFPGMTQELNEEQFAFLKHAIKEPFAALSVKTYLEKVAGVSGPTLAAAIFYNSGKDVAWCANRFGLSEEEIRTTSEQIANHLIRQKKLSAQAKKFLELIK